MGKLAQLTVPKRRSIAMVNNAIPSGPGEKILVEFLMMWDC
ncbi:MAG: hypothetical protein ABIF88_04055 [archaeon]